MAKPDWITITPASGSNNGSFDVTAAANTGLARNGIITVAGGVSKTCDIVQKSGKAIFAISNISIASEAVLSDVNPKYGELIDRNVEVHLMVGSSGLIDMRITFEGVYRIMSAEGDNEGMGMSTTIQGFNVIVEIDNIWIYGGGGHITVTGYDKANTPFECYISLMAQMV
uniref:BACON domain-containing protein n=1 Tax=Lachnospira sp. TaxID=2049031 RepID=UPI003FEFC613